MKNNLLSQIIKPLALIGLVAIVLTMISSCQNNEADHTHEESTFDEEAARSAIMEAHDLESMTMSEGNIAGYMEVIDQDCVLMPPSSEPIEGAEAIETWYAGFLEYGTLQLSNSTTDMVVMEGWAYEHYNFEAIITVNESGESESDNGKGIHIWKQQEDGSWRIYRDIWNSDNPPPSMEEEEPENM